MRIQCLCIVFLLSFSLFPVFPDDLDSELMQDLLREKRYDSGLTYTGLSGLLLTTSSESLYEGQWLFGVSGFVDRSSAEAMKGELGFNLVGSWGIWEDAFWGWFKDFEVSIEIPLLLSEMSFDTDGGLGDVIVSGKLQMVREDPLNPDVPSISLVGSMIVPMGSDEFGVVDKGGLELGIVFGATIPDSSGTVDFKVYLELRVAYVDYDTGQDMFRKTNFGISFPLADVPDYFLLLEYASVTKSDKNLEENGNTYLIGIRYQSEDFNMSVGFKTRNYEDLDLIEHKLYIMFDKKF